MFIVVDISDDNRQCAGSHCRGLTTVSHHYWHVVLLLFFAVERRQARHNPSSIAIVAST